MSDKKQEAQAFMNKHKIDKCYECDGQLYKHEENANARKLTSNKDVITHELNAGVKKPNEKT